MSQKKLECREKNPFKNGKNFKTLKLSLKNLQHVTVMKKSQNIQKRHSKYKKIVQKLKKKKFKTQ